MIRVDIDPNVDCGSNNAEACEMVSELLDSPNPELATYRKWVRIPFASPIGDGYEIKFRGFDVEVNFKRAGVRQEYSALIDPEYVGWIEAKVDEFFQSLETAFREHTKLGNEIGKVVSDAYQTRKANNIGFHYASKESSK